MSVLKYGFRRALTALEHALFCPVFVGATLRGRPLMGNFSHIEVYLHAHAHPMDVLFLLLLMFQHCIYSFINTDLILLR